MKQYDIMTDSEIVKHALSNRSRHHLSYILPVARMYEYDYERIFNLVSECIESEKETKKIIKSNFPKLYSQHRRETFIAKLKSLFSKKEKEENEEEKSKKQSKGKNQEKSKKNKK